LEANFAQIGGFLYFGSHFGLKMAKSSDLGEIGFQVDYDVAN
jgi:hypothetical protein